MRLIETTDLTLHTFAENTLPEYAILSHTWTDDEVTFAEFHDASSRHKDSFKKVQEFCKRAAEANCKYAWADTCCIDKSSSTELSEAINSMYRWYKKAKVCYVYLSDVPSDSPFEGDPSPFAQSRWFTRGWTLQELIAPRTLTFFSSDWTPLGQKWDLGDSLSEITGIRPGVLVGHVELRDVSIAQRMSWASGRKTTREEDLAYCLMGLFNVNMPMLYGEGDRAFRRLQEEIMKSSTDTTLFAWENLPDDPVETGMLAPSVKHFKFSGDFEDKSELPMFNGNLHTSSVLGINMNPYLAKIDTSTFAILKCAEEDHPDKFAGIEVRAIVERKGHYVRVKQKALKRTALQGDETEILIRHDPPRRATKALRRKHLKIKLSSNTRIMHVKAYNTRLHPKCSNQDWLPRRDNSSEDIFKVGPTPSQACTRDKPWEFTCCVPTTPNTEAMHMLVKSSRDDFSISIGLDERGELAFHCLNRYDLHALTTAKYRTGSMPFSQRSTNYIWQLDRPDLRGIQPGQTCHVSLEMTFSGPMWFSLTRFQRSFDRKRVGEEISDWVNYHNQLLGKDKVIDEVIELVEEI